MNLYLFDFTTLLIKNIKTINNNTPITNKIRLFEEITSSFQYAKNINKPCLTEKNNPNPNIKSKYGDLSISFFILFITILTC